MKVKEEVQINLKMIKNLALILAVLLISISASCSNKNSNDTGGDKTADISGDGDHIEGQSETPDERFAPNLPDMDFEGYEFRSAVVYYADGNNVAFDAEEENGDTINDAIYKRNRYVENKYNVILKEIDTQKDPWTINDDFKRSVNSDSDDFDIFLQVDFKAFELVAEGYVLSVDKLPYVDITKPWYAQDINEAMSVGGKKFIAFGDECLTLYDGITAICFNKKLIQDIGLESPYDLVKNSTWTYDKFFDMCKAVSSDIDGDGKMTEADRYGVASQNDRFLPLFWVCGGVQTVIKDSEDMLMLNLVGNEKLISLLENAWQNIYGGEKIYFDSFEELGYTEENRIVSRRQFENNSALFYLAGLGYIPALRAMDSDFGIIPFPKVDEREDRYYSRVANPWPKIVPVNAPNPERTSIILEALAAESRNTTVPALKEVCLKTKFARDEESVDMIDLIFDNVFMDLGDSVYWDIRQGLTGEMMGKGNFVSFAEKNAGKFQKLLDQFNDLAADME